MISRSAIKTLSLSGDDERSGDSGVDLGGVSSAPAIAASTRFTMSLDRSMDGLWSKGKGREIQISKAFQNFSAFVEFSC